METLPDFFYSVDDDEVEAKTDALRKKLEAEDQAASRSGRSTMSKPDTKGLKSHQVHDLAQAKIEETEKLRRALGIREDYEEGSHWRKGEERLREAVSEAKPASKKEEVAAADDESERHNDRRTRRRDTSSDREDDRRRKRRDDVSDYDSDSSRSYSD